MDKRFLAHLLHIKTIKISLHHTHSWHKSHEQLLQLIMTVFWAEVKRRVLTDTSDRGKVKFIKEQVFDSFCLTSLASNVDWRPVLKVTPWRVEGIWKQEIWERGSKEWVQIEAIHEVVKSCGALHVNSVYINSRFQQHPCTSNFLVLDRVDKIHTFCLSQQFFL